MKTHSDAEPFPEAIAPTRRGALSAAAAALAGLAAASVVSGQSAPKADEEPQSTGAEALLTYLHQEIDLDARRERVYEVLLDSRQFAAFTGLPADIARETGGAFTLFGGRIVGRHVELVPSRRIVQAWRPATWAPGLYSLVRFELAARGSGSTVVLDHTGFPEGSFRHLDSGWYKRYWDPLRKYLG